MNYPIINFIEDRVSNTFQVFEYGTGSSTLFWGGLAGRVVSVEHHPDWYQQLKTIIPKNVELIFCPLDGSKSYSRTIMRFPDEEFEIVVVDGEERSECLKIAPEKLSPGGVIIFDDSDRDIWKEGVQFLLDRDFKELKFSGLKPTGFGSDQASIFYRADNCLGI